MYSIFQIPSLLRHSDRVASDLWACGYRSSHGVQGLHDMSVGYDTECIQSTMTQVSE